MALKVGSKSAKFQEIAFRKKASFGPGGIEQGSRMTFRKHKSIISWMFGILRVKPHDAKKQGAYDIGCRTTTCGMTTTGFRGGSNTFHAKMERFIA
jgi:hypothetical protein